MKIRMETNIIQVNKQIWWIRTTIAATISTIFTQIIKIIVFTIYLIITVIILSMIYINNNGIDIFNNYINNNTYKNMISNIYIKVIYITDVL